MQKKFKLSLFEDTEDAEGDNSFEIDNTAEYITIITELGTISSNLQSKLKEFISKKSTSIKASNTSNTENKKSNTTPLTFEEIDQVIKNKTLITNSDNADFLKRLQEEGCRASEKFGLKNEWQYQVQLLYNAWLTEKYLEKELNNLDSQLRKKIQDNLNSLSLKLGSNYKLEGDHNTVYFAEKQSDPDFKISKDLQSTETEDEGYIQSIEVKTTADQENKSVNTHNADLVIYYKINEHAFWFYIKKDLANLEKEAKTLNDYNYLADRFVINPTDIPCKQFKFGARGAPKALPDKAERECLSIINNIIDLVTTIKALKPEQRRLKNKREVKQIAIKDFN